MEAEHARIRLCQTFCEGLSVSAVPVGLAVSTAFVLPDGDAVTFYIRETPDGLVLEDDGDFMATAIASGLPLESGNRARLLDGILHEEKAYLDRDTWQIKSLPIDTADLSRAGLRFLSALVRSRDMYLLSQDLVASTFTEDVRAAVESRLKETFDITDETDSDNPADFLLRDRTTGLRRAIVYAANSNEKLMAAVLRHQERHRTDSPVIAVLDDLQGSPVSAKRFMMAQNRGLPMPFFRIDPAAAVAMIANLAGDRSAA